MKKIFKKSFGILLIIALCLSVQSFTFAAADEAEDYLYKTDDFYHYVQKFTDVADVNNVFHTYYLENALGSAKAETVTTDPSSTDSHWVMESGVVRRINDVKVSETTGKYETNQVAMLTFTKEAYLNFELSVDFLRGAHGFWPVVAIRQIDEGKYYLDDGAGVFVQESGMLTLWGDDVVSGPYEFSMLENYNKNEWHNLQIRVIGNDLWASVDNQPWAHQGLPENFYDTGYVSLVSVNNETSYRNFRIKALPEPETPPVINLDPIPEASTDDSLTALAGTVKPKDELFEREGKINTDLIYETEATGGCSKNATGSMAAALLVCALCAIGKRII